MSLKKNNISLQNTDEKTLKIKEKVKTISKKTLTMVDGPQASGGEPLKKKVASRKKTIENDPIKGEEKTNKTKTIATINENPLDNPLRKEKIIEKVKNKSVVTKVNKKSPTDMPLEHVKTINKTTVNKTTQVNGLANGKLLKKPSVNPTTVKEPSVNKQPMAMGKSLQSTIQIIKNKNDLLSKVKKNTNDIDLKSKEPQPIKIQSHGVPSKVHQNLVSIINGAQAIKKNLKKNSESLDVDNDGHKSPLANGFNNNHGDDSMDDESSLDNGAPVNLTDSHGHHSHNHDHKRHFNNKKIPITGVETLFNKPTKHPNQFNKIMDVPKKLLIDTSIDGSTRLMKIYQDDNKYKLITLIEELDNEENIQSNIYWATVTKIEKSNNSIFLQYENGKNCFLNIKELIKQNLSEKAIDEIQINDKFIVQMIRERKNHKHPKVTTNIMMYGLYANIIVESNFDVTYQQQPVTGSLYTTLSQHKNLKNIKICLKQPPETINQKLLMDDIKYMIRTWKHIKTISKNKKDIGLLYFEPHIQRMIRVILDNEIDEIILDDQLLMERIKSMPFLFNHTQSKNMMVKSVNLLEEYNLLEDVQKIDKLSAGRDGIRVTFQRTEALTTVDVDYSSKNNKKPMKNLWEINKNAAHLIIEEIIKKNIGGSVLVDFINMYMTNDNHNLFIQFIKNQFSYYGINSAVYNIRQLGLVVICLPYNKYDIFHRVYEKCSQCQGGMVIKKIHQLNDVIEIINDFCWEKKVFQQEEIYSDGQSLFIKHNLYNNLVKYKPFIIHKLMDANVLPLIFN